MRKKIKLVRYIATLFLTIIIFLIGIYFGNTVERLRVEKLYNDLKIENLEYSNLHTEFNYVNFLIDNKINELVDNKTCDLIKGSYFTSIKHLDDARIKLENYINYAKIEKEEFYRLKEHYIDLQIDYYILAEKINEKCGGLNIILYFYGNKKKCPACEDEGIHLSYVKKKLRDNVLIFALDTERNGPIKLLNLRYDINHRELPVLVINNKITGFKTNQEIFKLLNVS